jgi:hypothetical protein
MLPAFLVAYAAATGAEGDRITASRRESASKIQSQADSETKGISDMKRKLLGITLTMAAILLTPACNQHKSPHADTVLINARIFTVNPKEPWAQAMAIREGKIIAVGSDKSIATYQGPSTKVIDAKEHLVLPGFIDAHVHLMAGAAQLEQISLNEAKPSVIFKS